MSDSPDFRVVARTASDVGVEGTYDDPTGVSSIEWTWPHLPNIGDRVRFGNGRWFRVLSRDWDAPNPLRRSDGQTATLVITITDDPPE